MSGATMLADDATVVQRILDHIDNKTTDLGDSVWREPVANYRCPERFAAEMRVLRSLPTGFCPSAALPEAGSFVARNAAGTPLLAVRDGEGRARVFRNACRHRGTQVADGAGCKKAFVCRYHGWTYGLDGALRHLPHEYGFPGFDKQRHGLVEVESVERHGIVFAKQGDDPAAALDTLPELISPDYRLLVTNERDIPANWKVLVESFLEGYHIRATHTSTFYPLQFDNLNVVERFGRNNRIAFPYRAVHKLRGAPPEQRSAAGVLTYVYHLFPNVMVATFPERMFLVVLEPLAIDCTKQITYLLTSGDDGDTEIQDALQRGSELVDAGATEDREVVCAIQRGLDSGANEYFEFGLFEHAIGHFHRSLNAALAGSGAAAAQ